MKNLQVFLKTFLTTAFMGYLALSTLSFASVAELPTSEIVKDKDGTTVQTRPDGTKIITSKDGTTIQVDPNGTKFIKKPNGTSVQINPDGSKSIKNPDGSTVDVKPGK